MSILLKQTDLRNTLSNHNRTLVLCFAFLSAATMLLPTASAQTSGQTTVQQEVIQDLQLNQAELDQILAPIALYPDSLLSQILVASTYPLEVVQATRWRQANSNLDEDQALAAVENKDWDPSVKALAPFEDLLVRLSEDLDWLQNVGDAFLQNEEQVLVSVQNLRQIAYDNGSIADNDYYQVTTQDDSILIESTEREIVYVPYYDTRVVYGDWRWAGYAPTYWHRPRNYVHLSGGFYWNSSYYVRPNIFFGGFHWGSRRLVVNNYYYDNYYGYTSYHNGYDRRIPVSRYSPWSHNPNHRRGVRYPEKVIKRDSRLNNARSSALKTTNRATRNTTTADRRQSVTVNQQRQTQIVRPRVSNSRVINKNTSTNRVIPNRATTKTATPLRRTAIPQRATSTVRTTQTSTPRVGQRTTNQKVTNQRTNRVSATTRSRVAQTVSKPSTSSTARRTIVNRTANIRAKSNTNSSTSPSSNRSKWSRQQQ